jgi:hypothetical protein
MNADAGHFVHVTTGLPEVCHGRQQMRDFT